MSTPTRLPVLWPGHLRVRITHTEHLDVGDAHVVLDLGELHDYDIGQSAVCMVAWRLMDAASVAVVGANRRAVAWVEQCLTECWADEVRHLQEGPAR